ncbi:hypothetical protein [Xanthomonas medicagonis]|uniref:hypothetical protein n=1 Tax=Xanthomonas medicagonis TaxID=3160841 RepID=UPI003513CAD1
MTDILDRAAAAAASDETSTSQLDDLLTELRPLRDKNAARLKAIHPGDHQHNRGTEYSRVLSFGATEELASIRQEFQQLQEQQERVLAQCSSLGNLRRAQAAREAQAALPDLQGKLEQSLASAAAARAAWLSSLNDVNEALQAVKLARHSLVGTTFIGAAASFETVDRLIGLASPIQGANFIRPDWRDMLEAELGVKVGDWKPRASPMLESALSNFSN